MDLELTLVVMMMEGHQVMKPEILVGVSLILTQMTLNQFLYLKGPTAAALYGARAGNGVILITTKKGSRCSRIRNFN